MKRTLVLNADGKPLETVTWQQAMSILVRGKGYVVEEYPDDYIQTVSKRVPRPAVIARYKHSRPPRVGQCGRRAVIARDSRTCQYCGYRARVVAELTIDHVIPRSHARGGWVYDDRGTRVRVNSWENLVAACEPCNRDKADRTPDQAGMTLARRPRAPTTSERAMMGMRLGSVPYQWLPYLTK